MPPKLPRRPARASARRVSLLASAGLLVSGCGLPPPGRGFPELSVGGGVSARVARHRFPRLANQLQLCYDSETTRALFDQLPLWDVAVVDAEMVRALPEYLGPTGKIRSENPDAVLLTYFSAGDVNPHLPQPVNQGYIAGFDPSWYLRDSKGQRVPLFEMRPGVWTLAANQTTAVNRYLPKYLNETVVSTGLVDGVFYDWISTSVSWINRRPSSNGNGRLDLDGRGKPDTDETTDAKWTKGIAQLLQNSRESFPPGTLIVGNGGWNTDSAHVPLLNGIMIERFLDGEREHEERFGWVAVMRTYADSLSRALPPRISILMANSDDAGDLPRFRFALASALLFDGYFCFTNKDALNGYQSAWWYDEYAVDLVTGEARRDARLKGYLGSPLSAALDARGETLALALRERGPSAGERVWRRDFVNGIVLVNPSRSSQPVELGGPFRRILGKEDPRTNDGGELQRLDLEPRSGLILLRPKAR